MINEVLNYKFKDVALLQEALTHPSISKHNYERLEFLGDAVLSLVIAELLIKQFPNENEGDLAKRKSMLVSGEMLTIIANQQQLGGLLIMSESESRLGGKENHNNLENALEAIIGAIYLDSDIKNIKSIITTIWHPFIENMHEVPTDPKSKLQEILQKDGKALPKYELVETYGPKHMPVFKIRLKAEGFEEVISEGRSKQQAEKEAAKMLLQKIN